MKRMIMAIIGLLVFALGTLAAQDPVGTGIMGTDPMKVDDTKGSDIVIAPMNITQKVQEKVETQAKEQIAQKTVEQIKSQVQVQKLDLDNQSMQLKVEEKNRVQNQNEVRLTVQTMLMVAEHAGIGQEVATVARQFNNSLQNAYQAEEQMQERSRFTRLFVGGDHEAAQIMEQEANRIQERIQEMNQVIEDCECEEAYKVMLQEQVQLMDQERERLLNDALQEKKSKGLFGWIYK